MNYPLKPTLLAGSALMAGSLLIGCASKKPEAPAAPAVAATAPAEAQPSFSETDSKTVTAVVQAINKKKRTVTLRFPDGKTAKVNCGPEIRNFPQIQIGDNVTAMFKETVEISVVKGKKGQEPDAAEITAVERAPAGTKPGGAIVQTGEISAIVESIDYNSRKVVLRGPEGKTLTVTAGPKVKRLEAVKPGDLVVARFTEALALEVSTPTDAATKPGKNR